MRKLLPVLLLVFSACSSQPDAAPQRWNGYDVRIQTQPSPPRVGMNEIMVMVSGRHGKGIHGLVISTRMNDAEPWKQTFPDGDLGIYHGAEKIDQNSRDLQVMIDQNGEKTILHFGVRMDASR
ncbi:MAG: hypothetical protein HKL98_12895 [Burkholderiales bacterium]|nr:hypothetical protein [Burkholderiales bacterium]